MRTPLDLFVNKAVVVFWVLAFTFTGWLAYNFGVMEPILGCCGAFIEFVIIVFLVWLVERKSDHAYRDDHRS